MNKNFAMSLAMALAVATVAAEPFAQHGRNSSGARTETHVSRTERVPHREHATVLHDHGRTRPSFAPPNDPFHDVYKRNVGLLNDKAPRHVANIHAKISAAEAASARRAAEAARASEPINVPYSNCDALLRKERTVEQTVEKTVVVVNKQVNISNSTVVVN